MYPIYFRDAEHTNSRVWLVARCKPDERHARLFLSQRFDPAPVHFSDFLDFFNDSAILDRVVIAQFVAKAHIITQFFKFDIGLYQFAFLFGATAVIGLDKKFQYVRHLRLHLVGYQEFLVAGKMFDHANHHFQEFVGLNKNGIFLLHAMKRFGNLYDKICTFDNLLEAFYKARKGKRNKPNVAAFEANLEWELLKLVEELKSLNYQPGPYRTFQIYDPKERMISAAPFRDRVVHHALCNIIEPLYDPALIADTYANRFGKGSHAGIYRCQKFTRSFSYVLKADIRKYFPSIDHEILKEILRKKTKCKPTLWLIDLIIDNSNPQEQVSDYFSGDDLFAPFKRKKGLPMGNLTSQFFANLYLSPLDHFVKEDLAFEGYVRYVDDFVLFHDDKSVLHAAERSIREFLSTKLRLRLHDRKTFVAPIKDGISFLGQRIFTTHRRLKSDNVRRFKKRLEYRLEAYSKGEISPNTFEMQLNSWIGHARQADTWRLQRKLFRYLCSRGLNVCKKDTAWKLLEWRPIKNGRHS